MILVGGVIVAGLSLFCILEAPFARGMLLPTVGRVLSRSHNFLLVQQSLHIIRAPVIITTRSSAPAIRRTSCRRAITMTATTDLPEYEVEQKFALNSVEETKKIEQRLQKLGFEKSSSPDISMVDWYWEDARPSGKIQQHQPQLQYSLTTQDCWLRLRQIIPRSSSSSSSSDVKNSWQLKLSRKVPSQQPGDDNTEYATVYEEVVGMNAMTQAISLLPPLTTTTTTTDAPSSQDESESLLSLFLEKTQLQVPPELLYSSNTGDDETPLLVPFAMIETQRSSWVPSSQQQQSPDYANLKVDFDTATYGTATAGGEEVVYAVGEVEEVVHREDDIAGARIRVQTFVDQLTKNNNNDNKALSTLTGEEGTKGQQSPTPVGKLEYYLIHHRPKHYQALVDAGILK